MQFQQNVFNNKNNNRISIPYNNKSIKIMNKTPKNLTIKKMIKNKIIL